MPVARKRVRVLREEAAASSSEDDTAKSDTVKTAGLRQKLRAAVAASNDYRALARALEELQDAPSAPQSTSPTNQERHSLSRVARSNTVMMALEKVKSSGGRIGIDIGGTLAKMVFMDEVGEDCGLTERFGKSGRRHVDLSFRIPMGMFSAPYDLHFVSGETSRLQSTLEYATQLPSAGGSTRKVVVSGGGAHRFAECVKKTLNVEMMPFQEMESLVCGLEFLHDQGPENEVFMLDEDGQELPAAWPVPFFPCLLVNMGSGVSVLRIDGRLEPWSNRCRYVRLGGTACGGATFLGLMKLLTSATSFEEALELVSRGDASKVNTLVGDIYGADGCATLGLPATMTAAYFGKLMNVKGDVWNAAPESDRAAALLMMVVQESVVLGRALSMLVAEQCGHSPPVFFVGGFLHGNRAAQRIIARTFRSLKLGPAMFLRHADFLGALGSLSHSLESNPSGELYGPK